MVAITDLEPESSLPQTIASESLKIKEKQQTKCGTWNKLKIQIRHINHIPTYTHSYRLAGRGRPLNGRH